MHQSQSSSSSTSSSQTHSDALSLVEEHLATRQQQETDPVGDQEAAYTPAVVRVAMQGIPQVVGAHLERQGTYGPTEVDAELLINTFEVAFAAEGAVNRQNRALAHPEEESKEPVVAVAREKSDAPYRNTRQQEQINSQPVAPSVAPINDIESDAGVSDLEEDQPAAKDRVYVAAPLPQADQEAGRSIINTTARIEEARYTPKKRTHPKSQLDTRKYKNEKELAMVKYLADKIEADEAVQPTVDRSRDVKAFKKTAAHKEEVENAVAIAMATPVLPKRGIDLRAVILNIDEIIKLPKAYWISFPWKKPSQTTTHWRFIQTRDHEHLIPSPRVHSSQPLWKWNYAAVNGVVEVVSAQAGLPWYDFDAKIVFGEDSKANTMYGFWGIHYWNIRKLIFDPVTFVIKGIDWPESEDPEFATSDEFQASVKDFSDMIYAAMQTAKDKIRNFGEDKWNEIKNNSQIPLDERPWVEDHEFELDTFKKLMEDATAKLEAERKRAAALKRNGLE